jgi:hypothetical protein
VFITIIVFMYSVGSHAGRRRERTEEIVEEKKNGEREM